MESVIKKIFSDKVDEEVHLDFVKFGKGTFTDKYIIEGKRQKNKWAIKTSAEFGNFFVRKFMEKAPGEVAIKGAIISTINLEDDEIGFKIEKRKNFMGIRQILVDTTVDPEKILSLMDKYPKLFFGLTFSTPEGDLKIKAKAPRSKSSSKGNKKVKVNFCSLKTTSKDIIDDLFFDFPDFKTIIVNHTIMIEKIKLPEGEKDPVKIREKAIREGVIKRFVDLNSGEEEFIEEKKFSA